MADFSPEQLALQALMRVRERRVGQRTQCSNQIRGLLAEHGIIMPTGIRYVLQCQIDLVPQPIQSLISELLTELRHLDDSVRRIEVDIDRTVKQHPMGQHLPSLPGIGKMNALAMMVTNPLDYKNGRHFAAYLGVVPKQTGTGGKVKILGVSKRGNRYHRKLLCDGARAILFVSKNENDPLLQWARRIQQRRGANVAVVALANKLARICWHIMNGEVCDVNLAVSRQK